MKEKLFGGNQTLFEIIVGILFFALVVQVAGFFLSKDLIDYAIGLWIGAATAIALAFHMAHTIEKEIECADGKSANHTKYVIIRFVAVVVLVIILFWLKIGNPFTCFAGVMGLKIGAYLQPLTHKIVSDGHDR